MAVSVKDYVNSMKSVSSSTKAAADASNQSNLKTQQLLAQLIEALSYANSVDVRKKTLNNETTTHEGMTGKQVLAQMKAQEKLIQQLSEGQKLDKQQKEDLTRVIDKFYEFIGAQEIDYKKFAASLEKFAMQDLPEAVKTRVINDSRDAHMIGQDQKSSQGTVLPILKKIRNLLEDSAEDTKQFTKKLFVNLDEFREGFLGAFKDLGDSLSKGGDIFDNIIDAIKMAGIAFMGLQGQFKEGNFKWGMGVKQFASIKHAMKFLGDMFTGVGKIVPTAKSFLKIFEKFGIGGVMKAAGKGIAKGIGKGALKKIPLVGTVLSIWMGIERWKQGDYAGALIEFGSGVAAMFPGVGTLISIALDLINLGKDTGFFSNLFSGENKVFKPVKGLLGKLFGGNKEEKGAGGGSTNFGANLANAALVRSGGRTSSTGKCALAVGDALSNVIGEKETRNYRGNAWQWISKLNNSKYFNKAGVASSNKDLQGLPAGSIAVWDKQPKHPYGHIEIADGKGSLISDFKRNADLNLYRSNPAGIKPIIYTPKDVAVPKLAGLSSPAGQAETSASSDTFSAEASASEEPMTFDAMMSAFAKFNEDIVSGVSGSASQASSTTVPTVSDMTAGTPSSATASAVATQTKMAASAAAKQQSAPPTQMAPAKSAPDAMDTDIQDTSLALMNSILFQS